MKHIDLSMSRMETWKPVVGAEGLYEVSDLGRVRSLRRIITKRPPPRAPGYTRKTIPERILRPGPTQSGHRTVVIVSHTRKGSRLVHHLVLEAFSGLRPRGLEALHLNGDPTDNRLLNLKWGTRGENLRLDYALGVRDRNRLGRWKQRRTKRDG